RDGARDRRAAHRDPGPQERSVRVRVREVQPAGAGLGDRRCRRSARERRHARRPGQHGPDTAARAGGRDRAPARRLRGRRGARSRGRNRTAGGPQRVTRIPHASRAGARPARARGDLSTALPAAVLAAGRGVRFGGDAPKVLTRLRGRPLLAYALDSARESGCTPVLLVVSDERVAGAAGDGIEIVRNDAPERGIASSLQCALRRLEPDSAPAVVVGLADQPLVGAEAYRRVARAHAGGALLAFASYDGVRGNPVLIARTYWSEALRL